MKMGQKKAAGIRQLENLIDFGQKMMMRFCTTTPGALMPGQNLAKQNPFPQPQHSCGVPYTTWPNSDQLEYSSGIQAVKDAPAWRYRATLLLSETNQNLSYQAQDTAI